jgi:DNA modification methylase
LVESELIHGDCLIELPKIFDKKIDLILTDPPYGTTQCKWDSIIPFELMWNQLKRVIKDNGCIALFGSEPFSSALRMSNIKQFKYDWVWQKNKPTGNFLAKTQPMRSLEQISVFYKNKSTYNPQKIKRTPEEFKACYRKNNSIYTNGEQFSKGTKGVLIRKTEEEQWYKYPINLIKFNLPDGRKGKQHPTQKPVALLEYLIKTYTNENDTVLDFTMGSGSTGVACKNLNRNFIGIEKDDKYFDIAKQRIFDLSKQRIEGVLI